MTDTATTDLSHPAGGETITVAYVAQPGLLGIALVNAILNVLTLTVYRFWAKTRVRRHVWSCVRINGEPLEYTGTGLELFLGALIVFFVLGLPIVLILTGLSAWLGQGHPAIAGVNMLVVLLISILWGMALYRARRYRLSRTLWRGIRSTLAGSSLSYSFMNFGATLLRFITLGWTTPAMDINLQERMFGDMRFGNLPFRFSGRAGPLYRRYALCWFTSIILFIIIVVAASTAVFVLFKDVLVELLEFLKTIETNPKPDPQLLVKLIAVVYGALGIFVFAAVIQSFVWSIYTAREMNVFASYTAIDKARFKFNATALSLIWLWLGNLLLVILTVGIAAPFAQQRFIRYLCNRLSVEGTVDFSTVMQSREQLGRTGEGLADAFDIGGFI